MTYIMKHLTILVPLPPLPVCMKYVSVEIQFGANFFAPKVFRHIMGKSFATFTCARSIFVIITLRF